MWGNQKGDANYHQSVMRQIARHYKSTLPDLRRVKIWSDGQRAQYKGRMNFGRMVDWPNAGDMGLEIWHSFFVSHHGSGPQDIERLIEPTMGSRARPVASALCRLDSKSNECAQTSRPRTHACNRA